MVLKSHTEKVLCDRIAMTRLVAVLCMIYVHVPDGQSDRVLHALPWQSFTNFIQGLFIEGPGRAGASLLSVVSGFLTAKIILQQRYSLIRLYKRRVCSILIPMVFWSVTTYFVYNIAAGGKPTFIDEASTLLAHLNILLFLTDIPNGATMHLAFLRDLFVCVFLSPVLLAGLRKYPIVLLSALGFLYLTHHHYQGLIVLRPLVLFAFTIGILLAQREIALDALDHHWRLWTGATVIVTLVITMSNGNLFTPFESAIGKYGIDLRETILYPLCRLFGSLAIWTLISRIFSERSFVWAHRLSPYVFTTFCSHQLLLNSVYMAVWMPLFGSTTDANHYLVWFVMAPMLSLVMGITAVHAVSAINHDLGKVITGWREPTWHPPLHVTKLSRR